MLRYEQLESVGCIFHPMSLTGQDSYISDALDCSAYGKTHSISIRRPIANALAVGTTCDKFSRAALSSEIASIELGEYMSGYDFTETTRGTTAAHITKSLYDGMEIRTRGLAWDEVPLHWSRGARHEAWPWW
jgi:hypothetical protein